jgi:hypothetical protein
MVHTPPEAGSKIVIASALAMNRFLKMFSSRPGEPPSAANSTLPADEPAAAKTADDTTRDATQPPLPLEGEPAIAPNAAPLPAGRSSRALRVSRPGSTSLAVPAPLEAQPQHLPVVPTVTPPVTQGTHHGVTSGVFLTQTERVRLRIMQAQIKLQSLALYEGPIDGMLTLETATAVRYFQTLKGLRESGQLTAATLRALGVPSVG